MSVVWDEMAFRRFTQEQIVPKLLQVGARVESQAKLNATGIAVPGARNPAGRGPRIRTGRLRSSITVRPGENQIGPYVDIGTNVFYGRHLEVTGVEARGGKRYYPFLGPALRAAPLAI